VAPFAGRKRFYLVRSRRLPTMCEGHERGDRRSWLTDFGRSDLKSCLSLHFKRAGIRNLRLVNRWHHAFRPRLRRIARLGVVLASCYPDGCR
jgi:hypothetical protein